MCVGFACIDHHFATLSSFFPPTLLPWKMVCFLAARCNLGAAGLLLHACILLASALRLGCIWLADF